MKKLIILFLAFGVLLGAKLPNDLPAGHVDGARLAWVDGYTLTLGTTNVVSSVKDSTGLYDIIWTNAITINLTNTNRVDANSNFYGNWNSLAQSQTLISNTLYYVYAVAKNGKPYSNTAYALVSTNATAPEEIIDTVSTNVDKFSSPWATNYLTNRLKVAYRQVGSFLTWNTNSTIQAYRFTQSGTGRSRDMFIGSTEVTSGSVLSATGGSNIAYTTVSLAAVIPDTAVAVYATASTTNGSALSILTGTEGMALGAIRIAGINGTSLDIVPVYFPVFGQAIRYKVATAVDEALLYINGWKEEL